MDKWKKEDLSFVDSWKTKEVEVAAAGALVVGVGALAASGHGPQAAKYGLEALQQAGKGAERYLKRYMHPVIRHTYTVGKNTYSKFKRLPKLEQSAVHAEMLDDARKIRESLPENVIKEKARERMRNHFSDYELEVLRNKELNPDFVAEPYKQPSIIEMEERVRQEMFENKWNRGNPTPEKNQNQEAFNPNKKKPQTVDERRRQQMIDNVVGSAAAGTAFGGGITLFHALNDKYNQKQKDRSFEAAGSFYKKGGTEMDKIAGTREIYDAMADWTKKIPAAAATGIGFTGVSLGTASLINKRKEEERKLKEQENERNRIIIEFGADDIEDRQGSDHIQAGGFGMMPRPNFDKTASSNRFLKNLAGRSSELNALKQKMDYTDYKAEAAASLKGKNVDELVKAQYGHLFDGEKARDMFLESQANRLKHNDFLKSEQIKNEVAKTRLPTFGLIGLTGAGAGAYALNKKDGQHGKR